MTTLYISDLDGTLLNSSDGLSTYTVETINNLIRKGMLFSYATARSHASASAVTQGLALKLPVIVYNGASIRDASTGEILHALSFSRAEAGAVARYLTDMGIHPLVYAHIEGTERVSWLADAENDGIRRYLSLRKGDRRLRPVNTVSDLYAGDIFYFTCIDERDALLPAYERFSHAPAYTCFFQQELYREEYWCEILPKQATKGNALGRLKAMLRCDRIVSFGDALNDLPMFSASDRCYAVGNAVDELKRAASAVIASHDEDGVARWLAAHFPADS